MMWQSKRYVVRIERDGHRTIDVMTIEMATWMIDICMWLNRKVRNIRSYEVRRMR